MGILHVSPMAIGIIESVIALIVKHYKAHFDL